MRVNAITAMAAATATIAGQPLSITTGRIVARMMEPGSARRPRSIRGVIGTRLMSSTPPMRHRNVTSIMLVPLWKGAKSSLPWLIAGLVSLIIHALVPGYLFIIAGALAGVIAGMLIE